MRVRSGRRGSGTEVGTICTQSSRKIFLNDRRRLFVINLCWNSRVQVWRNKRRAPRREVKKHLCSSSQHLGERCALFYMAKDFIFCPLRYFLLGWRTAILHFSRTRRQTSPSPSITCVPSHLGIEANAMVLRCITHEVPVSVQ